jgi:N-methylhydantoinase A
MGYRIAIDTGGTFTDLVLADEQGNMYLGKAPTTFGRIFSGIVQIQRLALPDFMVEIRAIARV